MKTLLTHPTPSAETAFAAYEAARHRLPGATRPGACAPAATLDDLAGRFDVFLLDAFGVLNIGETPIDGVAARIAGLREAGKRVLVITNAAGRPPETLRAKYARLGYEFPPEDIVSSRQVAASAFAAEAGKPARWGVMVAEESGLGDFAGADLTRLGDAPGAYAEAGGFLLLGSGEWTEARQARLEVALAARPRPVWVANPDVVAPREDGFSLEPGFFAHRLAERTGTVPRFFGKPFPEVFDAALARIGPAVNRARVVMVGDSLHTDVLGAQAAGVGSALVAGFGFFAGTPVEPAIAASGIRPDFILQRP